jgi:hypothetical protein
MKNLSGQSMCRLRLEPSASRTRAQSFKLRPYHSIFKPVIKQNTFHVTRQRSRLIFGKLSVRISARIQAISAKLFS